MASPNAIPIKHPLMRFASMLMFPREPSPNGESGGDRTISLIN
jgi:hypothetical protein